jgi:hypothetical protein
MMSDDFVMADAGAGGEAHGLNAVQFGCAKFC